MRKFPAAFYHLKLGRTEFNTKKYIISFICELLNSFFTVELILRRNQQNIHQIFKLQFGFLKLVAILKGFLI